MEGAWRRILVLFVLVAVLAMAALEVAAGRLAGTPTIVGVLSHAPDSATSSLDVSVSEMHVNDVPAFTESRTK